MTRWLIGLACVWSVSGCAGADDPGCVPQTRDYPDTYLHNHVVVALFDATGAPWCETATVTVTQGGRTETLVRASDTRALLLTPRSDVTDPFYVEPAPVGCNVYESGSEAWPICNTGGAIVASVAAGCGSVVRTVRWRDVWHERVRGNDWQVAVRMCSP